MISLKKIALTGLLGTLAWLMVVNPKVLAYSKYLLDSYAFGYSPAKPLLLVVFLAALSFLSLFPVFWRPSWNPIVLVGSLLLYLASLSEHIYYSYRFGLGLTWRSVFVSQGLQSSTRLEHIHTSKAALAQLVSYGGQSLDVGRPFLAVFPSWWLLAHGLAYLVFCGIFVLFVRHYQSEQTPERALVLGLGAYTLVKGLIDGGPFAIQDIAQYLVLTAVFIKGKKRLWLMAALTLLFSACFSLEISKGFLYLVQRVLISTLALSLPLFWEQVRVKPSSRWIAAAILVTACLGLAPVLDYHLYPARRKPPYSLATIEYGNSTLEKGWNVTIVSSGLTDDGVFGEIVETRWARRLSVSTLKLSRPTTPFELCQHFELNILRSPVLWYPQSAFVVIEGPFSMEAPEHWLRSETILATSFSTDKQGTKLVLEVVPGAQTNVAVDALPPGPYPTLGVDLLYTKPKVDAPWQPGPGAR